MYGPSRCASPSMLSQRSASNKTPDTVTGRPMLSLRLLNDCNITPSRFAAAANAFISAFKLGRCFMLGLAKAQVVAL